MCNYKHNIIYMYTCVYRHVLLKYLFAFVADIVGISVHGKPGRVLVEASPWGGDGLRLV